MYAQLLRFGLPAILVLGLVLVIYRAGQESILKDWDAANKAAELVAAKDALRRAEAGVGVADAFERREQEFNQREELHQEQLRTTKLAADRVREHARALERDTQASRAALQERVAVLSRLFEESVGVGDRASDLLAEGRRGFERAASKLDALQAWDREVCR